MGAPEAERTPVIQGRWAGPLVFFAVAVAYGGLAQTTAWLHAPSAFDPVLWPGAGLSLAVLLLVPTRRWGWVIAGVGVAELTGNLAWGFSLAPSLWWVVANAAGPLAGATLLRRLGNPDGLLVPLHHLRSFLIFGALAGPALTATVGTIGTFWLLEGSFGTLWQVWPSYLLSDALGVLVVAPLLLAWRHRRLPRHPAEVGALALAFAAVWLVALVDADTALASSLPYLLLPLLTWAGLRFGIRGAAVAVFVMTQVATWTAVASVGPFVATPGDAGAVLLPVFLLGAALSVFVLAAVVEGLSDTTEVQLQLTRQAFIDDLTGLPNRRYLTEYLSDHTAEWFPGRVVVFTLDLDHFKFVNDGFGHEAGDEVLIEVARRLERSVRPGDVVARSSGDEFIAIVHAPEADILPLANRLMGIVAEPITLSTGGVVSQAVSVGVADGAPGDNPELALRGADAALHHAKHLGRAQAYRFNHHLQRQDRDRRMVQSDLRRGLEQGQIVCHYQPEIDLVTGQVVCFEALARWNHPTEGLLTPDRFIPAVEDMGAIGELFETVLTQALAAQTDWASKLGSAPDVAVNLSANQLGVHSLPTTVATVLARTKGTPGRLWLEVTETALTHEPFYDVLLALYDMGVKLAIDDFGTGWSSISRLAAFPWDLLKIDRSFVAALGTGDGHAQRIISSTITLAHDLGMATVAEGVETSRQLERLTEFGCDYVQGYHFSRAVPTSDVLTHVAEDRLWTGPGSTATAAGRVTTAGDPSAVVRGPTRR
jgi:diguanylate cyclase (GGDEF)-like protein